MWCLGLGHESHYSLVMHAVANPVFQPLTHHCLIILADRALMHIIKGSFFFYYTHFPLSLEYRMYEIILYNGTEYHIWYQTVIPLKCQQDIVVFYQLSHLGLAFLPVLSLL